MIKDKVCVAHVKEYNNYLKEYNNCLLWYKNSEKYVTVIPRITFLWLLTQCYKNSGSLVYEINQYGL